MVTPLPPPPPCPHDGEASAREAKPHDRQLSHLHGRDDGLAGGDDGGVGAHDPVFPPLRGRRAEHAQPAARLAVMEAACHT